MKHITTNTIVISAINLREGGPLTILRDCLCYLSKSRLSLDYRIIALVHDKTLCYYSNIEYIEFKKSASRWLYRLYYEYIYFRKISKDLNPYLWLSLHDMTPNIKSERQAVYMHNPIIVNHLQLSDIQYDKTYILFTLFYKYLYKINIHKNNYCIVQQAWFRDVCSKTFKIPKSKIIVARPLVKIKENINCNVSACKKFFYPSFPRSFKNFEILCNAATILWHLGYNDISIKITLDGSESEYSKKIIKKYKDIPIIDFCGILDKVEMENAYNEADCLIFPSRLETWGLPISEFKQFGKPMIIADEQYAHETAEGSICTSFFSTKSPEQLADLMKSAYDGDFSKFNVIPIRQIDNPKADSYESLFELLLRE